MKKYLIIAALCCCYFYAPAPATAQKAKSPVTTTNKRGTAQPQDLAQPLFAALQTNSFNGLLPYFPNNEELKAMQEKGDKPMKALLEMVTTDELAAGFKSDFDHMMEKSLYDTLNWSTAMLNEVQAPKGNAATPALQPVELIATDTRQNLYTVKFETIKINGRYYLFRHVGFKK